MENGCEKRIYAEPALQKFLEARASGAASPEEMEKLKQAASEESRRSAAIDAGETSANGKSLDQFLSDNGLTAAKPERIGRCGRRENDRCGLINPSECEIHGQ
jgi:hypothetical protein